MVLVYPGTEAFMIGCYFVNITAQIYRIYRDLFVKYHVYRVFVKVRRKCHENARLV